MSKEGFVYIPQLEEDIKISNDSAEYDTEIVFEDDKYKVYHALNENGLIWLSMDTKWMGGYASWSHKNVDYNQIDIEDNHYLQNPTLCYVIVPADYKPGLRNNKAIGKKFLIQKGYGECFAPSGASYAAATLIYNTGDRELWKYFLNNNFQYITTNLEKKVGAEFIKDKTELVYPDDFENPDNGKLSWSARRNSDITKITIRPDVTELPSGAFANLRNVESVEMPDSVVKVGSRLFAGCSSLRHAKLSANLKAISNNMFTSCPLEEIEIPSSVTRIGDNAFYYWADEDIGLKRVVLPKAVKKIGRYAFAYQRQLTEIVLNEGLKEIDDYAFENCHSLKSIHLPNTLTTLGNYVFYNAGLHGSLFIPKSVTKIGECIAGDTKLQSFKFEAEERPADTSDKFNVRTRTWTRSADRYGYDYQYTYIDYKLNASRNVNEDLEISSAAPNVTPAYSDDAWKVYVCETFGQLYDLCGDTCWFNWEEFELADSNIYNRKSSTNYIVFYNIQQDTRFIYNPTRWWCGNLDSDNHYGIQGSYGYLFNEQGEQYESTDRTWYPKTGTQALERFLIDMNDEGLQRWAINKYPRGLDNLRTYLNTVGLIEQLHGVVEYGSSIYSQIREAGNVVMTALKRGISIAGEFKTFKVDIVFPRNLRNLPNDAFDGWRCIESIELPETLRYIGRNAFSSCSNLQHVTLPSRLEEIDAEAFWGCGHLHNIIIPASVKYIGPYAFGHGTDYIECEATHKPDGWDEHWCASGDGIVDFKKPVTEDINVQEPGDIMVLSQQDKDIIMNTIVPKLNATAKEIVNQHKDETWKLDLTFHPSEITGEFSKLTAHPYRIYLGPHEMSMNQYTAELMCDLLHISKPEFPEE